MNVSKPLAVAFNDDRRRPWEFDRGSLDQILSVYFDKGKHARVAQWLEHWSSKPGVVSSILSSGINITFFLPVSRFRFF